MSLADYFLVQYIVHAQWCTSKIMVKVNLFITDFSPTVLQLVWLVVFTSTVLLGVDLGLGVGVAFSLLVIVIRTIL